jgi:hypothetical protein
MSKSLENEIQNIFDKKSQINLSPRSRDRESLKNMAIKIYMSPIRGGISEGLLTTKNELTKCFNKTCTNQDEVINKTNDAMKFIEEWLSMLVAQNIIRKINGNDFLNNCLDSSSVIEPREPGECPHNKRTKNKSPKKSHQGTRY